MMSPQDMEGVVQERISSWEREAYYRQLLLQLPQEPPRWRRWAGSGMVWAGTWIMRWGERMTQRECQECVSTVG